MRFSLFIIFFLCNFLLRSFFFNVFCSTVTRVFDNRIRDLLVIWFCCVQVQQQQQEEDDETLVPNSDLPEGPQPMEGKLLSVFFPF